VEGNISSGKSTFLQDVLSTSAVLKVCKHYIYNDYTETRKQDTVHIVPEPVQSWQSIPSRIQGHTPHNLLQKFYDDPTRYAYTFQNYVFMTRYLQERNSSSFTTPLRIMERSVFSDRYVFVESVREAGWLSEMEGDLYNAWLSPMVKVRRVKYEDGRLVEIKIPGASNLGT